MENQIVKELFHSKCKKDSKSRHNFEEIGVVEESVSDVMLVWRCTQCQECILEPLVFMEVGEDSFRMSEEQESERQVIGFYMKKYPTLSNITRKRFHSLIMQIYYLGQLNAKEFKNKKSTSKVRKR